MKFDKQSNFKVIFIAAIIFQLSKSQNFLPINQQTTVTYTSPTILQNIQSVSGDALEPMRVNIIIKNPKKNTNEN